MPIYIDDIDEFLLDQYFQYFPRHLQCYVVLWTNIKFPGLEITFVEELVFRKQI